jgi:general secretion pathway protein D
MREIIVHKKQFVTMASYELELNFLAVRAEVSPAVLNMVGEFMRHRVFRLCACAAAACLAVLMGACATSPFGVSGEFAPFAGGDKTQASAGQNPPAKDGATTSARTAANTVADRATSAPALTTSAIGASGVERTPKAADAQALAPHDVFRPGTGRFVAPRGAIPTSPVREPQAGDVTLNFEEADLRLLVKQILGDLLGETYVLDPAVKGKVSIHNTRPLSNDDLLPLLESLLQIHGAALVRTKGIYQVLPLAKAARAVAPDGVAGSRSASGFATRIVPLHFASAEEVAKILEPYVPDGGALRAVAGRNILILSAPGRSIDEFVSTVEAFDVSWIEGMSMGMFRLVHAEARTVVTELQSILGAESGNPMAGLIQLLPIDRLNAVLVLTPQRRYLQDVKNWLDELDQGGNTPGRRLYVYDVKNGKAEHIAQVLNDVFEETDSGSGARIPAPSVAPGLDPVTVSSAPALSVAAPMSQASSTPASPLTASPSPAAAPRAVVASAAAGAPTALPVAAGLGPVRITADSVNNALLVMATREAYAVIEAAIKKIDILPRQVLVEATVAEVKLVDGLQYGVQWFVKGQVNRFNADLRSLTSSGIELPIAATPGLSAAIFKSAADVRVFINALQNASQVKVLSSPQVLVMDNQTANIRVGTQVPITTRSSTSAETGDALVQEVEFRDTGVLLTVTPRVNAGGIVTMDVSQEVSVVGAPTGPSGNVSIDQRTVQSSIAVLSGETIVMGGLIEERSTTGDTGIPLLSRLPIIGALFGNRTSDTTRTELIIMITPSVINNPQEAREVSRELRQRLRGASSLL